MQYLDYKGISKYKFYQETGITNGILSQSNGLSEENTLKFLSKYRDISLNWLFYDEGSMLKTETPLEDTSNDVLTPENGVLNTLKGIIKEQALEIARLELEVEKLKNTSENG